MKFNIEKVFRDYISRSKSRRLNWERIKLMKWFPTVFFSLLVGLMIVLILTIITTSYQTMDSNEFIAWFVPTIFVFQLIILTIQFINQYNANKFSMINGLPQISVMAEHEGKTNEHGHHTLHFGYAIKLFNFGINAYNISYAIKIDKNRENIIRNDSYFSLFKDRHIIMYFMEEDDFVRSLIEINLEFEGQVSGSFGLEKFVKYPGHKTFSKI